MKKPLVHAENGTMKAYNRKAPAVLEAPRSTATKELASMQPQYTCHHCGQPFTPLRGSRVKLGTGCWEWRGNPGKNGYGRLSVNGIGLLVHRLSYEHFHGPIPEGFEVCHRCDNRICMNPDHLFLGTHHENVLDAQSKNRLVGASLPGESNPFARLTDDSVRDIRRRYAAGAITQRALADEYGVDITTVSLVIRRKSWRHVE